MRTLLFIAMACSLNIGISQCPTGISSKNGSCVRITYSSSAEATAAVTGNYTATVTQSTTGADGSWTAIEVCSGTNDVLYEKTGGNCNCSGNFNQGEDGVWTFSTGDICEYFNGALPVFYSELYVEKDDGAIIHWMTSSEINNDHFILERSKDGKSFEAIGKVEGTGQSNTERRYAYLDHQPFFGVSYYRIIQVDFNGTPTPSELLTFRNYNGEDRAYYNVSSNQIEISNINKNTSFALVNYNGIFLSKGKLSEGSNSINVSTLPKGIYLVSIIGEELITRKVLVY